jgi:hypothetical protein
MVRKMLWCNANIAACYKYCGALQILRCATNIAVRCTLALPLAACYKYCGALHLSVWVGGALQVQPVLPGDP